MENSYLALHEKMAEIYRNAADECIELTHKAYGDKEVKFPIDIGLIADHLGLNICRIKMNTFPQSVVNGITGRLVKTSEGFIIQVEKFMSKNKQRYAIAHAIGHYMVQKRGYYTENIHSTPLLCINPINGLVDAYTAFLLLPLNLLLETLNNITQSDNSSFSNMLRELSSIAEVPEHIISSSLPIIRHEAYKHYYDSLNNNLDLTEYAHLLG